MVPSVDTRETELLGLNRLQNEFGTKTLFVVLSVLALLSLAAVFAQPARADLLDAADAVADETSDVVEPTVTENGTTIEDSGASGREESNPAPLEEIVEEVVPSVVEETVEVLEDVPPVVEETVEVLEDVPPVVEDVTEVVDTPPVAEEVLDVVEIIPPVVEDSLTAIDTEPVVEVVEDPPVEIVVEAQTVADVVVVVPPRVVDVVRVLPLFVPAGVESPELIEVPTDQAITTLDVVLSQPIKGGSQQSSGLFTKELAAEMTLFHLGGLTQDSAARGSSASPLPERETAAVAADVPMAGTVPVVGGAGGSSSTGSSHSGSSFFGGLDAFSFFAAMAALLALCLVGWIRDRSRSGRSVFPSHGGRPG